MTRAIPPTDRDWIRAVYRDYLSELSASKSGLFPALGEWPTREDEFLAAWFNDSSAHPFVILSGGARAGFALVARPGDFRVARPTTAWRSSS